MTENIYLFKVIALLIKSTVLSFRFIFNFTEIFLNFQNSKQFWQPKSLTWNFKIFNENIAVNYEGNLPKVVDLKVMKPFALSDCIFLKQRSQQIVREKLSVLFSSLFL